MARRKKVVEEELVTTGEAVEDRDPVTYEDDEFPAETTAPLIAVSVVMIVGDKYVLEWRDPAGSLRRAWADAVIATAPEQALNVLRPYGDDLSAVVQDIHWSQAEVLEELHRMGVWRLEDLNANVLNDMYQGMGRLAARDTLKRKSSL